MYGFKPQHARGKPVQNFADGGIVHSIKGALGLRPRTQEELLADDAKRMAKNREAAAAVAERNKPAPSAPQAQQNAVSGYAGMSVTQRREKELGLKDGGRVEPRGFVSGKGTGTSDSIKARLSNGEYVLPADTVKAVGVEALDALRAATHTPVKHEQAKAAHGFFAGGTPGGVDEDWQRQMERERSARTQEANSIASEAMAQSQAESDKLAAQSSLPKTPIGGLANNGGADASRFAQVPAPIGTQPGRTPEPAAQPAAPVPTAASTQSAGQPLDAQAASDRAKLGAAWDTVKDVNDSAGRAIADVAMLAPRAVAGAYDSAVVRPMRAAGFNAGYLSPILVPNGVDPSSMTPYADQKRMQEQAGAVAPSAPAATSSVAATASTAGAGRGVVNPPLAKPSAPAPSAPQPEAKTGNEIMPGVFKHGRGQYSDQSTGMGMPAGFTGQPSAQNNAILQRMSDQSQAESMARVGMSQYAAEVQRAKNINADEAARNNSVGARMQRLADPFSNEGRAMRNMQMDINSSLDRNGRPTGKTEALVAQSKAMSDGYLAEPNQQRTIDAGIQREGMQQEGATTRTGMTEQGANTRDAGRTALARDEFGLKKEAAGFQTRADKRLEDLQVSYQSAKTPEERAAIVQQLRELQVKDAPPTFKSHVMPNIKNADGSTTMGGVYQENLRTGGGQWIQPQGQDGAQAMPKPASKAEFDALPKGARFTDPNGQVRIK